MGLTASSPRITGLAEHGSGAVALGVANVSGWAGPDAIDRIVVLLTLSVVAVAVLRTLVGLGLAVLAQLPSLGAGGAGRLQLWSQHVTPRIVLRIVAGLVTVLPVVLTPPGNAAPGGQPDAPSAAPSSWVPIAAVRTYVVRHGDSLWSIAAAHLPRHSKDIDIDRTWRLWYAANRSTIGTDPNNIVVGQVLAVPAAHRRPASTPATAAAGATVAATATARPRPGVDTAALAHRFDPDRPATTTGGSYVNDAH